MNEHSTQGDEHREPHFSYRTVICPCCGRSCEAVIEAFDTLGCAVCVNCETEFNFESK